MARCGAHATAANEGIQQLLSVASGHSLADSFLPVMGSASLWYFGIAGLAWLNRHGHVEAAGAATALLWVVTISASIVTDLPNSQGLSWIDAQALDLVLFSPAIAGLTLTGWRAGALLVVSLA